MRKSLGKRLKDLRLDARKSVMDVVTTGVFSKSKLQDIENGARAIKLADVWALCRLYGVEDAQTNRLAEMAQNTSTGGWWEDYTGDMPSWFSTLVELEVAAVRAFMYDGEVVPGLLQTPGFQLAQFETHPEFTAEYGERQMRMRSERQRAVFARTPPLILTAVLGQETLTRMVGGEKVMTKQKAHLREVSRLPNIDVRVLPWSVGAHPANKGAFTILDFDAEAWPSIGYLETYVGGRYVEDARLLRGLRQVAETISVASVPIEEFLQ